MTPENFCYWLQGLLEVGNPKILTEYQLKQVKEHLQLVFKKETSHSCCLDKPIDSYRQRIDKNDYIFNNYVPPSDFRGVDGVDEVQINSLRYMFEDADGRPIGS